MTVSSRLHDRSFEARSAGQTLDEIFRAERRRMFKFFAWRAGRDAASDLVQEVFVRAAGSPNFSVVENLTPYIWKIARNLLIERARKNKRRPVHFPLDEQRDRRQPPEQCWRIEADDAARLYAYAVDHLPEKTRRVFLMSRLEHRTYREISEEIAITVATVNYHVRCAMKVLRESFADCCLLTSSR